MRYTRAIQPVRPNRGYEDLYERRLRAWLDALHRSALRWVLAAYRRKPPLIAQDARMSAPPSQPPARALRSVLKRLRAYWMTRFSAAAGELGEHFAQDVGKRSDAALRSILRRNNLSVRFRMPPELRDVMQAAVGENVSLIRTIPEQYLGRVEQAVMRSVARGRDLASLERDLNKIYRLSKRRVRLIARDQNNKATSQLTQARQLGLGIERGVWQHSHAGKEPRPTHVAMSGKEFNIAEGMYDSAEGRNVMPGELINCRCTWRPIVRA